MQEVSRALWPCVWVRKTLRVIFEQAASSPRVFAWRTLL